MPGGVAATDAVTVNAKDFDGNTIVGSGNYIDANGDPVTISLNVENTRNGGSGTVSLQGSTRISGPTQQATIAQYDGRWLDHAVISATTSSPLITTVTNATLTTPGNISHEYPIPTSGAVSNGITLGSDGNLWFTEAGGNKIGVFVL